MDKEYGMTYDDMVEGNKYWYDHHDEKMPSEEEMRKAFDDLD